MHVAPDAAGFLHGPVPAVKSRLQYIGFAHPSIASHAPPSFVTSAVLAALAGVLFTHYTGGISPSEAGAMKSVRYVALAAAGGMANLWGVAIVSVIMNFLSLRGWFGSYDNAVFGALLIIIVSVAPDGPVRPIGWLRRFVRARTSRTAQHGAA